MSIHHVLLRIVFYSLTNEDPNDNYFSIIPGVPAKNCFAFVYKDCERGDNENL
jgi:hypothetical protein